RLRDVAAVIEAELPAAIYYVSMGGVDTHARQSGPHALLLQELSQSVAAFLQDIEANGHGGAGPPMELSPRGPRGGGEETRGGAGRDRGTAAPPLPGWAGGSGGGLGGAPRSLEDLDDGDLRSHTVFRRVYATVLGSWLGLDPKPVLGGDYEPLSLIAS